ncbi:MAG: hypothetical protein ACXWEY_09675 [Bacteroidia bacterium]
MILKDFIKNTISSISEAIIESQKELSEKGIIINPDRLEIGKTGEKLLRNDGWRYVQNLEFDVLIGVEDKNETGGKGEIKVAGILSIGGNTSGNSSNLNQSRIKFSIPVAFATAPTPDEYQSKKGKYAVK